MSERRVEQEDAPHTSFAWGEAVAAPAMDRRKALELVQRVSLAGRGAVTPPVLLERICAAVSAAFGFEGVTAVRFHPATAEVNDVAVADTAPAQRRPIAGDALLAQALQSGQPVLVSSGGDDGPSAFALPLMSGERCLGFLHGSRGTPTMDDSEADALATVEVVASVLLDDALAREEAHQRDVLKSEFIALAAHELRNPVSSIYGISVTLDERGDTVSDSERLDLGDTLRQQTTRLRSLIEQLLDLSRFDLAAIEISPERVRLRPKIEQIVHSLAGGRADAVTIAVPPKLDAFVDPIALDRMLSNLVVNALRHGEPPVTVSAVQRDAHLRLAVEDRGEGVRRDFVPRLFDRFTRSPESHGRTEGSGLGLSIARAYARAHGGDLVYAPSEPHGARFEVVLPLRATLRSDVEAVRSLHGPSPRALKSGF